MEGQVSEWKWMSEWLLGKCITKIREYVYKGKTVNSLVAQGWINKWLNRHTITNNRQERKKENK